MNQAQKIIKYFAIGFAVLLIMLIITVGVNVIEGIFHITNKNKEELKDMTTISERVDYVSSLKVNLKATNLEIKEGKSFKVETNNEKIIYSIEDGKVFINDRSTSKKIFNKETKNLIIYLPIGNLDSFYLDAGYGKVKIDYLNTKEMNIDLGAGTAEFNNVSVSDKTIINGGAGVIDIAESKFTNLKLDLGVGKSIINANLYGNSEIEAGVGSLELILDDLDNYKIECEKGIGSIKLNNNKLKNNETVGNGSNYIKIEGGIGSINITTK